MQKPKRRWFRFSLRTLLVLATIRLCGMWLAGRQNAAGAATATSGRKSLRSWARRVVYDYQIDPDRRLVYGLGSATGSRLDSEVCSEIIFFATADTVYLRYYSRSDDVHTESSNWISEVPDLPELHTLGIWHSIERC